MVPETPARKTKYGLVNDGEGWFVVNAREARWRERESLGVYCDFEGKRPFPQLGINVSVLQPGESLGRYHRENGQEGFLVVAGECLVIVEDEERELKTWDFFHSPPQTEHIIVGAGDGPSVVVGGRRPRAQPQGPCLPGLESGAEARRLGQEGDDEAGRSVCRPSALEPRRVPRRLATRSLADDDDGSGSRLGRHSSLAAGR